MSDADATVSGIAGLIDETLKTPRILSVLFADYAVRDEYQKPVLAGIFDNVVINPPVKSGHMFFVYLKWTEVINYPLRIEIYSPSQNMLALLEISAPESYSPPLGQPNIFQGIHQLALPMVESGIYWFNVTYENRSLGMFPLIAHLQEAINADNASTQTELPADRN